MDEMMEGWVDNGRREGRKEEGMRGERMDDIWMDR